MCPFAFEFFFEVCTFLAVFVVGSNALALEDLAAADALIEVVFDAE